MTAAASDRKYSKLGPSGTVIPVLLNMQVKASTKIYANTMVARTTAGYAVPASADVTLKIVGNATVQVDNSSGANGAKKIDVEIGTFYYPQTGTTITFADCGKIVYAVDDSTVSISDGGGQYPAAGVIDDVDANGLVGVRLGFPSLYDDIEIGPTTFYCRAVAVSALAAYTAANGTITANANGALGAVFDGVTVAAGDTVLLPEGIAAALADAGPYVVTSLGSGGSKFVLTRPAWWAHGSFIPQNKIITIGPEGTLFAGTEWKSFVTTAIKVVGTDAPVQWPRKVVQSAALVAGTKTISNVPVRSTTLSTVSLQRIVANTSSLTTGGYCPTNGGANGITAGVLGTASIIIQACVAAGTINNADISTLNIVVENW